MVNRVVDIPLAASKHEPARMAGQEPHRPTALRQFLVGDENRILLPAIAAFLPTAENAARPATDASANFDVQPADHLSPAPRRYNPLVLVGIPGSGKSHLALGMARYWRQTRPDDLITCTTGSDFARELTDAQDTRTLDAWRTRYRTSELLVLEDVHQVASRMTAQVELLHTLDALTLRNAVIIITSRLPIGQIAHLLAALTGRLSAGLSVSLSMPGLATRRALVERMAEQRAIKAEPEALSLLAESLEASAADLFGALMYLETSSRLDGGTIRLEHARRYLQERVGRRMPTLRGIASLTAKHYAISPAELKSASRRRAVVQARGVAMHLARQLTGTSFERIGRYFGGRDHTTVLHSCRKIEEMLADDPELKRDVDQLRGTLAH